MKYNVIRQMILDNLDLSQRLHPLLKVAYGQGQIVYQASTNQIGLGIKESQIPLLLPQSRSEMVLKRIENDSDMYENVIDEVI